MTTESSTTLSQPLSSPEEQLQIAQAIHAQAVAKAAVNPFAGGFLMAVAQMLRLGSALGDRALRSVESNAKHLTEDVDLCSRTYRQADRLANVVQIISPVADAP